MDLNKPYPKAQHFDLERKEFRDEGWLTCMETSMFESVKSQWASWLHSEESLYYESNLVDKRKNSFLLGRICAKISYLQANPDQSRSKINIKTGVFKDPILQNPSPIQWQIGITHSNKIAAAIAFPATHPMAIDIEEWDTKRTKTMKTQCRSEELHALEQLGLTNDVACTVCWTAKEAISKALRTGMTSPFELFGIKSVEKHSDGGFSGLFVNYCQYQFRSWILEDKVLCLVLPKRTRILFSNHGPKL